MLKEAQVEIIPSSVCNSSDAYGGLVNSNMLCAGSRTGGIDTCQVRTGVTSENGTNATRKTRPTAREASETETGRGGDCKAKTHRKNTHGEFS